MESDTQSVVPFITFIKGILDYIFTLEDNEIRKAFQVFAILSYIKNETSRGFADELHIILHKQLAHSALIYKRIGIIGGVAMIRPLAYSFQHYSENTLDSILAWFNAILNNCRKSYVISIFENIKKAILLIIKLHRWLWHFFLMKFQIYYQPNHYQLKF